MPVVCTECKSCTNWSGCFEQAIANDHFGEKCIERIAQEIHRWFLRKVHRKEDAEDLTQEVCMALCRYYRNFNGAKGSGKAYVRTIARHVFIQYLKSHKTYEANDDEIPDSGNSPVEVVEAVHHCIDKLDFKQRAVLIHRDLQGLSVKEVKEITGIPETTQRLYREKAYRILERHLKRQGFQ